VAHDFQPWITRVDPNYRLLISQQERIGGTWPAMLPSRNPAETCGPHTGGTRKSMRGWSSDNGPAAGAALIQCRNLTRLQPEALREGPKALADQHA
jgi:hypothetical protein